MCPDCRRPLVELSKYRRVIDGDAAVGDAIDIPRRYNPASEVFFLFAVFDAMLDSIFVMAHKSKAKKLCARELPGFPNSLVCASCLFLLRRK
jgi:hypothetical protein